MLSESMQKALNAQLNAELYSGYLYLSMSAWFKTINLNGFANWMYHQAQEELMHAMKFYEFILQRGGKVLLTEVSAPPTQWSSPLDAFEKTLAHERGVTEMINDLMEKSIAGRDHAANIFLQWFVTEQVEEEESAGDIVEQLKLVNKDQSGLFMIDRELAQRDSAGNGET